MSEKTSKKNFTKNTGCVILQECSRCLELENEIEKLKTIVFQYKTGTRGAAVKAERLKTRMERIVLLYNKCPQGFRYNRHAAAIWKCQYKTSEGRLQQLIDLGFIRFIKTQTRWAWTVGGTCAIKEYKKTGKMPF